MCCQSTELIWAPLVFVCLDYSVRTLTPIFFIKISFILPPPPDTKGDDARVVTVAATNRPWDLDEAVLRRLGRQVRGGGGLGGFGGVFFFCFFCEGFFFFFFFFF